MLFKKEIFITYDLKEFNKILDTLANNNIKYSYSVNDNILTADRQRGVPLIDSSTMYRYRIFVKNKDYDLAKHVLGL